MAAVCHGAIGGNNIAPSIVKFPSVLGYFLVCAVATQGILCRCPGENLYTYIVYVYQHIQDSG